MGLLTKTLLGPASQWRAAAMCSAGLLFSLAVSAAVPGITGGASAPVFDLVASADFNSQPDGASIYSWGYGCNKGPSGYLPVRPSANAAGPAPTCPTMQTPGPTLIVREGDLVTVTLTNKLPKAAGNTSIVFPGFQVTSPTTDSGTAGLLAQEASTGKSVTYNFKAVNPGTYAYYSGSQPDLQIEMGLSGAIVVLPKTPAANCKSGPYSNSSSAYGHPETCYDREYLFQFTEMSAVIHDQVKAQVDSCSSATCPPIAASMEPYRPNYFLINGRSMPDLMDTPYSTAYAHQPYNGNPHMHPGERVLMRIIGQGRWQHPFHFHGNHARVLARDANMLLSQSEATKLAGPLLFTISTVSGQTVDAIFTWTGQGLNWDPYGLDNPHTCNGKSVPSAGFDPVTREYCPDHGKPMPATPPDPSIVVNGQWYGGTPYIGMQASNPTPEAPGTLNQNPQAGYAYMWHSHNEREITTNDVFPGGMMMMLLIDPTSWFIDETL